MNVTVSVAGGETREVDCEGTYADLLAALDLHPQEASVLVEGRPVPADQPVAAERVEVVRLVTGG
ncbi:MAG: ubiquitin-like small modifier protein 2 [Halobacteriaceae archaeon]